MATSRVLVPRENPRRTRRKATRRRRGRRRGLPPGVTIGADGKFVSARRSRAAKKAARSRRRKSPRRRRRNPLATVTNPRRRRRTYSRRAPKRSYSKMKRRRSYRRRRNPQWKLGRFKLFPPMQDLVWTITGSLFSKYIPKLVAADKDVGPVGYGMNAVAGVIGAGVIGTLTRSPRAATAALIGTFASIAWRAAWDYELLKPLGLQGPMYSEGAGYMTPAGFSGMVDRSMQGYIDAGDATPAWPNIEVAEGSMGAVDEYGWGVLPYN